MERDDAAIALVEGHYQSIDDQDWDKQKSSVADDFTALLGGHPACGFEKWQGKLKEFYEGLPDGRHQLTFLSVEGGRVLTVGTFSGTHSGMLMGKPPTGAFVRMSVMHVDRVVDGRISEHVAHADIPGLIGQLG